MSQLIDELVPPPEYLYQRVFCVFRAHAAEDAGNLGAVRVDVRGLGQEL
jgi:hypothetical protein